MAAGSSLLGAARVSLNFPMPSHPVQLAPTEPRPGSAPSGNRWRQVSTRRMAPKSRQRLGTALVWEEGLEDDALCCPWENTLEDPTVGSGAAQWLHQGFPILVEHLSHPGAAPAQNTEMRASRDEAWHFKKMHPLKKKKKQQTFRKQPT